jgi:tetratricopeptide (TPR) repeat protein
LRKPLRKLNNIIILTLIITFFSCNGTDNYNLGIYQARQGNQEKAIEYFSKAIEDNPEYSDAYYNRAYAQQLIGGKENQIITDYTKSLELNPNDNEAYMNRGLIYMKMGNNEKAISDYKESIRIKPDYSIVYANLGNAYKLNSDNEKACETWKKSLELGNENVQLRLKLNCG